MITFKVEHMAPSQLILANTVQYYKFTPDEIILDKYLKDKFKMSLREACKLIIGKGKIFSTDDQVFFRIIDNKLSSLAGLITYGNLEVKGSKILLNIFGGKYYGV